MTPAFVRRGSFATIALAAALAVVVAVVAFVNIAAAVALVAGGLAALLAATWLVGNWAWPASEIVVKPRIGAAAEVEALLSRIDGPVRLAVIGDIQNGISEFAGLLDEARRRGCDAVLLLGDCANIGRASRYAVLRARIRRHAAGVPVLAVPGNHDLDENGCTAVWNEWVGPSHWRIDVRGTRILGLDDAAGPLTPASMDLLRDAATNAPPHGVVVVSHRPLVAAGDDAPSESRARERQFANAGLVPALALSGHGHENEDLRDAHGARHVVQGENCDRSSAGDSPTVTAATLTLGDGPPTYEAWRVPRRVRIGDELFRNLVGSVYPLLRGREWMVGAIVALLIAAATAVAALVAPR